MASENQPKMLLTIYKLETILIRMIWRIHCTGYVGDPEATSTTLDPDGWLRTGDLCYIDEEGFLFVVDRLKELIKYKGYQVISKHRS